VVIANRRHTDLYEWGQRTRPLSLSAEIQHRLLPGPQTCEAGAFRLAGWLEPAAGIAGDTFDFSLARDVLHVSLTDAMGHGVGAALSATLCVGSLRNTRNGGLPLLEQVDYEDYRDVSGVRLPFRVRTSDGAPYDTVTRTFLQIRRNAAIDEAAFRPPAQ